MNALDELMAEFTGAAGALPAVNPPEASGVLETQTKPEVAGEPEPPEVETVTAPPTEKPADVKAAEAAKTRKPRGGAKNAGGMPGLVAAKPVVDGEADAATVGLSTDQLVTALQDRGYEVHLIAGRK
jgi:hypothetical protein